LIIEDIKDTVKRKKSRNVVATKNKKLLKIYLQEYNEAETEYFRTQEKLAHDFFILSENLTRYFKFHLIEPDDAIQEGVMICFDKVDRFVLSKGKAFNYMTTCIANHFRQLHRTSKNYNELKRKYHNFQQTTQNKTIIKNGKEIMSYNANRSNI